MKRLFILLAFATSLFAQDFIPYFDEMEPAFAAKMKMNGIKYLTIEAFKADNSFEPASNENIWKEIFEFNKEGKLLKVTSFNPEWQLTRKIEYAYNSAGEIQNIFETETTGSGDDVSTTSVTLFINRKDGRINFIDRFEKGNENPGGAVTNKYLYSYNSDGELAMVTDSVISTGAYSNPSAYYHYEAGLLVRKTHPNYTIVYEYDKIGLPVKETMEMLSSTYVTTKEYDGMANTLSSRMEGDAFALEEFNEIDENGLVTKTRRTFNPKPSGTPEYEVNQYFYTRF